MTMFSVLTVSAAVAFFSSPASAALGLDMISNGRYWWGGSWQHRPSHGDTNDCICTKGVDAKTGSLSGYCMKGLDFNDHIEEQYIAGTYDHNKPIDITIHGSDALWVDRFTIAWNGGQRWYGSQNTHGWCLSTDRNDYFDKYATHEGCHQTLSLNPNGNVYAYNGRGGYHNAGWLLERMQRTCQQLNGRRRLGMMFPRPITEPSTMPQDAATDSDVAEEDGSAMATQNANEEGSDVSPSPLVEGDLDEDPAGPNPNQVHNELQGRIVSALHSVIKELVTGNSEVTDEQIDSILNTAMLMIEQAQEREDGDEEVVEGDAQQGEMGSGSTPLTRRLMA